MEDFYFVAQTGQIYLELPKAPSNYFVYRIHSRYLTEVEEELHTAVLGTSGFEYSRYFLNWLDRVAVNAKSATAVLGRKHAPNS